MLAPSFDTGPDLAKGVGLPVFMLCLFVAVESSTLCLLAPPTAIMGGFPFVAVPFALPFVRVVGFGVDSSIMSSLSGLMNMPCAGGQLKYRCPCTDPSFFPDASSNSMPIQPPGANWVLPMNFTVALTPFESSTVCPTWKSESSGIVPENHGSIYRESGRINLSALRPSLLVNFIV